MITDQAYEDGMFASFEKGEWRPVKKSGRALFAKAAAAAGATPDAH